MDKKQTTSIPTRRDIRFLRKPERQRFFYCLKFLSVLPPQEQGNFRTFNVAWKIQNGQRYYKNVSPKNIHDEFISSHQTCCEHGTPYFPYFHRHLMVCFTIALNYAEQVLIGGKSRVPTNLYNSYAKYFDAVFDRYAIIADSLRKELGLTNKDPLPQLSAHYWNPVDYTENISIPEQLQQRTPDEMDKLYYAVNAHYAWNFNFATRWFSNNTTQPKLPVNFDTMGFFSSQVARYSDAENKVIYGTLNPRSTVQDEFFGVQDIDQYGIPFIANTASQVNLYKNYKKLKQTNTTIDVCTLDQQELNTLFGSKVKNLHWITNKQRQMLSLSNYIRAMTYNKSLPHYQFAYALYKKSNIFIKDYVSTSSLNPDNSMQKAHNTMHNLLQLFMSDSQLSITNPLFFLYHSWMDYMLEVKIRMIRASPNNKSQYNYTKGYLDTRIKPSSVLDQAVRPGQIHYGDYYIFEWSNPLTRFYPQINQPLTEKDFQYAFKSRNFIINDEKQGIRRSDQLSTFYSQEYLPKNSKRYENFRNFNNFIFDYNYEIHDYDNDGNRAPTEMKSNVVAIPSYIRDIFNEYGDIWNQNKTQSILPPKLNAFEEVDKAATAVKRNLLRQIRITLGGYATYSSSIKSTDIPIELKLTERGQKQLNIKNQFKQILKKGVVIVIASLFSRGVGAQLCTNCKDQKQYYLFISQKLAELNSQLFCQVSRSITRKTFFKQENNQIVDLKKARTNQLFTLSTPRPVFNRLQITQGANQVDFNVKFKGVQIADRCKVAISLYSYSIQDGQLENIIIRKKQTLDRTQFQFPRVFGVKEGKKQTSYIYRHVKGEIKNGDEVCRFQFDITGRYRLITFQINIVERTDTNNQGYLDVEIIDQHYDFKMQHYRLSELQA